MFVRLKEVAGRRYIYLVEGRRRGGRVRQRVLCYLGPLSTLAYGIPEDVKRRVEEENPSMAFDWNKINGQIRKIPLKFEELSEVRMKQYALAVKARSLRLPLPEVEVTPSRLFEQRSERELAALAKLAARGFQRMYEELGERRYRMRL